MIMNARQAIDEAGSEVVYLNHLAERLNRKKTTLEGRGWQGEAVYQWLCLLAGRYLRRFRSPTPTDPGWEVSGWAIGRRFDGPQILFDITQDRVKVSSRSGHLAWLRQNRL